MSAKMSVLYVPDTGHAVAAISRTSDPLVPFDLGRLGGDLVVLKNVNAVTGGSGKGEEFYIPSGVLKVTNPPIDLNEDLLSTPLNYALDKDVPHQLGKTLPANPVTLKPDALELVSGFSSSAGDLKVWTQVQQKSPIAGNDPEIRISTGVIPKGSGTPTDVPLTGSPGGTPISLPSGNYYVLVLVAEFPPYFGSGNVP